MAKLKDVDELNKTNEATINKISRQYQILLSEYKGIVCKHNHLRMKVREELDKHNMQQLENDLVAVDQSLLESTAIVDEESG